MSGSPHSQFYIGIFIFYKHESIPNSVDIYGLGHMDCKSSFKFLNLPLWANFYNHTDLSQTIPLDQLTLLDDLNQASPAAQVEVG